MLGVVKVVKHTVSIGVGPGVRELPKQAIDQRCGYRSVLRPEFAGPPLTEVPCQKVPELPARFRIPVASRCLKLQPFELGDFTSRRPSSSLSLITEARRNPDSAPDIRTVVARACS